MKNKTPFLTFLLALLLVFSISMAVSASAAPDASDTMPSVVSEEDSGAPETVDSEMSIEDIPTVQDITPADPEDPTEADAIQEETESAPAPQKSSNTPFFVGAGIAILLFAGVAVYCKTNGNKTL